MKTPEIHLEFLDISDSFFSPCSIPPRVQIFQSEFPEFPEYVGDCNIQENAHYVIGNMIDNAIESHDHNASCTSKFNNMAIIVMSHALHVQNNTQVCFTLALGHN